MTDEIVYFDTDRLTPYIIQQISSFVGDPPDSDHQRGYLAALLNVYREGIEGPPDACVDAAEALLDKSIHGIVPRQNQTKKRDRRGDLRLVPSPDPLGR